MSGRRLLPALAAVTAASALYQVYATVSAVGRRSWPLAALYAVSAVAGFALARALWAVARGLDDRGGPG